MFSNKDRITERQCKATNNQTKHTFLVYTRFNNNQIYTKPGQTKVQSVLKKKKI